MSDDAPELLNFIDGEFMPIAGIMIGGCGF